ncbi:SubName: Full=Related to tetratricopeptide TPR_2 repeat protein-Beijerinckia indica subsp. indica {ECO:0000313/EMBL:CCA70312.1} [Serendipita indica DSM 11827]|nr:SubName: Full=Related to tetratricopeptide TPR_2 repeat protein-Beijerinckia indica subsp. indica {ECO:0000313/EMBL:CCA70312.1} [Serendipita indica DSM 11827]
MALDAVSGIAGLIDFAIKLKGTFDQLGENRSQNQIIANNILISLQRIERLASDHSHELSMAPDIKDSMDQLEIELQTALDKCQRRYKPREGFGKVTGKVREWKDGSSTKKELTRLESNINTFYLHFLVDMSALTGFNTTRMDATMVNMQECLNKISLRIHTDIIPAAEEDPTLAEELVVGSATLDRPEITRAMEEATAALEKAPQESIEQQYLQLQIKTLRGKLNGVTPNQEKTSFTFRKRKGGPRQPPAFTPATQYTSISEPLPEAQDAIMESIRLLRRLETAKSNTVSLQTIGELRDLSTNLRALGLLTEAHEICLACVEMCRSMAAANPQSVAFDLALTLTHLSSSANDIGERDEALSSAKEAASIYRQLAQSRPQVYNPHLAMEGIDITISLVKIKDAFRPDLAKALIYHAYALLGTGRFQDSLRAITEAVSISRKLVAQSEDQYAPLLSKALNFLGVCLREHNRYDESIEAAKEAVAIRRRLVELRPSVYSVALTDSLNSLSLSLGEAWQYEEAMEASREAVDCARKRLVRDASDPNQWLLAQSLAPMAWNLAGLDMLDESVHLASEAIGLIRSLAADNEALRTDLSGALMDLGTGLIEFGRLEPALEALKESVAIRRVLVENYQRVQLPLLAESLDWMGWCLMGMGRRDEALAAAQESVDLFGDALRHSDCPDAFRMGLAMALSLLSRCLRLGGRNAESLKPAQDAYHLLETFPAHYPPLGVAFVRGTVLRAYSSALYWDGQYAASLARAQDSLEERRKLPAKHAPGKSESYTRLAKTLAKLGHWDEAHKAATEGVILIRPLVETRPGINRTILAKALLVLANINSSIPKYQLTSVSLLEEAVQLYRDSGKMFEPELSETLQELAECLEKQGRREEAKGVARETLEIREVWARKGIMKGYDAMVEATALLLEKLEGGSDTNTETGEAERIAKRATTL